MGSTKTSLRITFGVLAVLGLLFLLWYIRIIVLYFVIAAAVSIMGRPLVKRLDAVRIKKKKIPHALSAIIALFIIGAVFAGAFSLFIPLVAEEAKQISNISLDQVEHSLQEPIKDIETWLEQYQLSTNKDELKLQVRNSLKQAVSFTKISNVFESLLGTVGNIFYALLCVLFMSFYLLKDRTLLNRIIISVTPSHQMDRIKRVIENAKKVLTRYFFGIIIQISIITTLVWLGLSVVGVKNALLIGFFAGIINIIPYAGPFIWTTSGIVLGITGNLELDFYSEMLPFIGRMGLVFGIIVLSDAFFLQPLIYSNSVNAHPLEIFIVIMTGAMLAGIGGMLVAVPVYSFVRIILKEYFSEFELVQSLTRKLD